MSGLAVVTGASGFIGHHLVAELKRRGQRVRGVDLVPPRYDSVDADEIVIADLRDPGAAFRALAGAADVYALAADMGGVGYLAAHGARVMHSNLLIDANTVDAAAHAKTRRLFYASSACVYPMHLQTDAIPLPLREEHAFPAQPEDSYGWAKLTGELLCREYAKAHGIDVRIARFHNVYGPLGAWNGGREKAPAALCRKIAVAARDSERSIEVWGDGAQARSFLYVDDAINAVLRLMDSDLAEPVNVGHPDFVTVDELAELIASIAGVAISIRHIEGPQGVRGRTSNSSLAAERLGWKPKVTLRDGLTRTYDWIEERVTSSLFGFATASSESEK